MRPADRPLRRQDPDRRAPDRTGRGPPRGRPGRGLRPPDRRRQAGRDADRRSRPDRPAGPRRPPRQRRDRPLPSAQVHARLAGRGCDRDHRPARADGLGRGQVRRHPGPAPPGRPGGPAVQPRPARHHRPVSRGRRRGARPGLDGHPRRRDPGLPGRHGDALRRAPEAARPEGSVGGDPGRGARRLRRLRPAGPGRSRPVDRIGGPNRLPRRSSTGRWPSAAAASRVSTCRSPTTGGSFALSHLVVGRLGRRARGGLRPGPPAAQRRPDGQGPGQPVLARPPRPRLAEDEEGPGHPRLRRRRGRARPRQAPWRPVRLHVRRARRGEPTGWSRSARRTPA